MNVLIRVDASSEIGIGHLMRCSALAMRLSGRGAKIKFICGPLHKDLQDWLRKHNFGLSMLTKNEVSEWKSDLEATLNVVYELASSRSIDLLIVDSYKLAFEWESGLRKFVNRILVIDDLANRPHNCDVLIDQNLHLRIEDRYKNLLPKHTIKFLGPQYASLRPEFDSPGLFRVRSGIVKNLLVFFGGAGADKHLVKVIAALSRLGALAPETILLLGHSNPCPDMVYESALGIQNLTILEATDQISTLMSRADLAIGTCGIAAWERCYLGLPSIVVTTAKNQLSDAETLHDMGAVINLGNANLVTENDWYRELKRAISDPQKIQSMSVNSYKIMSLRKSAQLELERTLIDETI